jgi:hypothetical protein
MSIECFPYLTGWFGLVGFECTSDSIVIGDVPPGEVGRSPCLGGFFLYYSIVRDFYET